MWGDSKRAVAGGLGTRKLRLGVPWPEVTRPFPWPPSQIQSPESAGRRFSSTRFPRRAGVRGRRPVLPGAHRAKAYWPGANSSSLLIYFFIGEIVEAYSEQACLTDGMPDIRKLDPFTLTISGEMK